MANDDNATAAAGVPLTLPADGPADRQPADGERSGAEILPRQASGLRGRGVSRGPRMIASPISSAEVAGLLELLASERPDLLAPVVQALTSSPAVAGVTDLVRRWNVGYTTADELAALAAKTAEDLDLLERSRHGWRHPRDVVEDPNLAALHSFVHGRRERLAIKSHRRLEIIGRKLERAAESDRRREAFERFLAEPVRPVDPRWLAEFLGPRR